MTFWLRLKEFVLGVGGLVGTFLSWVGLGTCVLILAYTLIELIPFRLLDNKLDEARAANKHQNWRFRLKWCARHLLAAPLAYLIFATIWYGLHGNCYGFIAGGVVVLVCMTAIDKMNL